VAISTRPDQELETRLKKRAAGVSLVYNVTLTLLKLAAALVTGSVSMLSEATHSATDIVASGIAFISVRAAAVPPDDEHPYGHGKIESLAGFAESILLLLIVGYVAIESVQRLLRGSQVQSLDVGLWIMAFSVVTSYATAKYVKKIAYRSGSLALHSNSQHLMVDCVTSVGVLIALLVTKLTGWQEADPIFALALTVWMAFGAFKLARLAYEQLIDRRLEDGEIAEIKAIVADHDGVISSHRLRTRLSGNTRYIDMHIVVPAEWSVVQAHAVADQLEKRLAGAFAPAAVVIHVDPYDPIKVVQKNADNKE
jgi:cation diffusion facilitator family transporter